MRETREKKRTKALRAILKVLYSTNQLIPIWKLKILRGGTRSAHEAGPHPPGNNIRVFIVTVQLKALHNILSFI